MVTSDMDSTIRFWRDLLGMRLIAGMGGPGYRHYFFEISGSDMIAFFEWPEAAPVEEKEHGRKVAGPIVFDHVSFGVESQDMLWEMRDRLDAAGFWASEVIDHGFIHSVYSFDPNGIPVEFSWSVQGIDIHDTPVMKDTAPSDITLEGPEPRPEKWPGPSETAEGQSHRVYPGQGSGFLFGKQKK